MGITVIPDLSGSVLPGIAPASGAADVGASGGFAALLSSELLSQMNIVAELGGIVAEKVNDKLPANDEPAAEDKPDLSLFGHLAGVESSPKSIATTTAGGTPQIGSDGGRVMPEALAIKANSQIGDSGDRMMPEPLAVKANSQEAGGIFEKLMGNGKAAATAAPSVQAANIAVEMDAGEKPTVFANHLATSSAAGTTAGHAVNTAHPSVAAPLHSPAWPQQFGDKIVWLARNEQQIAQLNINPPQLGPVQVTVNLNGDQANIVFTSPHAEVRQAIESAMPQLKDMLSAAGINLGQANVGPNLQQQRGDTPFGDTNGTRFADENAILPANEKGASAAATVVQRGRGLIDLFA